MFLDNLNIGNIEPILALLGQIPNFVPIIDTEPVSNLQRESSLSLSLSLSLSEFHGFILSLSHRAPFLNRFATHLQCEEEKEMESSSLV